MRSWIKTLGFPLIVTVAIMVAAWWIARKAEVRNPHSIEMSEFPIVEIRSADRESIELLQAEWQTVIETQMHFNDLILGFRSMMLTVAIALVGGAVTLHHQAKQREFNLGGVLGAVGFFWLAAALLDLFYYHQLLRGAVAAAQKFDVSDLAIRYHLFGLTQSISNAIEPIPSTLLAVSFYVVPAAGVWVLFRRGLLTRQNRPKEMS